MQGGENAVVPVGPNALRAEPLFKWRGYGGRVVPHLLYKQLGHINLALGGLGADNVNRVLCND